MLQPIAHLLNCYEILHRLRSMYFIQIYKTVVNSKEYYGRT